MTDAIRGFVSGEMPDDFTATLSGSDGAVPSPWRASYVISFSMTGGARLLYAIDHASMLPWVWRVPVSVHRLRRLARLVISSGVLRSPVRDQNHSADRGGARPRTWLCVSATGLARQMVPLSAGGAAIDEGFRALVPASVWQRLALRRAKFLAENTHLGWG